MTGSLPKIRCLRARPILDSRGAWTVEASVELANGVTASASVPHGKSRGSREAAVINPHRAAALIEQRIAPALRGLSLDQGELDSILLRLDGTPSKRRLGGNTLLAVSLGFARAAARSQNVPLWRYFRSTARIQVPRGHFPTLLVNLINGGLHAGNNLEFQEYLVLIRQRTLAASVARAAELYNALRDFLVQTRGGTAALLGDEGGFAPQCKDFQEPFAIIQRVLRSHGWQRGIAFGLDAAASNISHSPRTMWRKYQTLIARFPLRYLEDPFGEEEFSWFARLREQVGSNVWIAGDDLTVTNVARMARAQEEGSVNAVIIKPNQVGTVTEALAAVKAARKWGWKVVVSHRSGETDDAAIADFAYGVGADGFKLGAPARGERTAKYNRLLAVATSSRG
ncbi:phosphopyruvate hydratase [Candidatus Parcubacteria bacterium]|nr:MAG: phosphopyruvate hydratase [Candidatus Parcubacteria bacterium]